MKKFTSIEQFRNVVATIMHYYERTDQLDKIPTLNYTGTVKLHGTNAGIRRFESVYEAQSKERIIRVGDDNYGFAGWCENLPLNVLEALFDRISHDPKDDITIYGEWIGPGIQSGCAINELINKQWVIVGAQINDEYIKNFKDLKVGGSIFNIREIPQYQITIDFNNPEASIKELEEMTLVVEAECPWGKRFGISGIGEGIVWTCDERPNDQDLWFKTKGEKHSGKNKSKKEMVNVDPQKVENINQCVDIILTEGRLKQGLDNVDSLEMKSIGPYLKWVSLDCMKEEMDTVEANELEWKDVVKVVNKRAKDFFINAIDEAIFNK